MKLCLLVSRRCDLRCGFCRVEFTGHDMSWETARRAVDRYLEWLGPGQAPRVKFFGGEPLLNFPLIERVVESGRGRWKGLGMGFELATNGSFLDEAKRRYLAQRPEVEVTLSQSPAAGARLPEAWFTLVLAPGCSAESLLARMRRLLQTGYLRFNFLPAYYLVWNAAEVAELERALRAASRLVKRLWQSGRPIRVKNIEVWSPVPLYNDARSVDTDGTIYASNMIQCEGMEKYRELLRIGSVYSASNELKVLPSSDILLPKILERWSGPAAWRSTLEVDGLLTRFVDSLGDGALLGGARKAYLTRHGLAGIDGAGSFGNGSRFPQQKLA